MPQLQIGTRVRIVETSEYFSTQGRHGVGTVDGVTRGSDPYYGVLFDDGYHNTYYDHDLAEIKSPDTECPLCKMPIDNTQSTWECSKCGSLVIDQIFIPNAMPMGVAI